MTNEITSDQVLRKWVMTMQTAILDKLNKLQNLLLKKGKTESWWKKVAHKYEEQAPTEMQILQYNV